MLIEEIREKLLQLSDEKYRDFQRSLIPSVSPDTVIGVRTPDLRKYAKRLIRLDDIHEFLDDLPHKYFDENQIHAFIISEIRDYEICMKEVVRFLPYVDNWATCDQLSPKVFVKHKPELLEQIKIWICSDETYTIRFGLRMLMKYFLDDDFDQSFLDMAAGIRSEDYYVNMMRAWFFATALAKRYSAAVPYLEERRLDSWTHKKTIRKAVESFRITPEQKEYLKTLKSA